MKKLTLILAAILALGSLTAKAQMRSGVDMLTLDQVKYRITYDAKQVNDTTEIPYIYRKAQMRLDIGSNITHFYNQSKEQWEQQALQMMLSGGVIDLRKAETPDWQLIPDSTTTIIGYPCQLAKTNFKGRTWLAWYAEDIPVSEGPWKLCGLPGLILRAYDAQQQFYLNTIGLEDLKGKETLKYAKPEEAKKVSQSDLTKIKLRDDGSEMLRYEKWTDENGKPIKPKARKRVFNPIER